MADPRGVLAVSILPLRRYAQFHGRSTRTEVLGFWLLTMFGEVVLAIAGIGHFDTHGIRLAYSAILLCPILALTVRRLHDAGFRTPWALLTLPVLILNVRREYLAWQGEPVERIVGEPLAVMLVAMASVVATLALLVWDDEPGANRWGPNPRYDDPEPQSI